MATGGVPSKADNPVITSAPCQTSDRCQWLMHETHTPSQPCALLPAALVWFSQRGALSLYVICVCVCKGKRWRNGVRAHPTKTAKSIADPARPSKVKGENLEVERGGGKMRKNFFSK